MDYAWIMAGGAGIVCGSEREHPPNQPFVFMRFSMFEFAVERSYFVLTGSTL